MTKNTPRFGAHMSVAGGLENGFVAGQEAGCECLQIFVKNQRQWKAPPLTEETIRAYLEAERASGIAPVVAHASYLLNLGSPEAATRSKSIEAMIDELTRCQSLGIAGLVFHPGAHLSATMESGMKHVAKSLDKVHAQCKGFTTRILLETTAGQGSSIGHRLEQISTIIDATKDPDRLGVCLDTCHLFAAGYDFRKRDGYDAMMEEMESTIGIANVRCIHMNDSKRELGSRVDRHDHIGKGKIGKEGFKHFVNDPRFANIPMILETPKGKDGRGTDLDKVNLKRLRDMVT